MATSSQKFIARNRAPRVQIEYDVELYGAEKKMQLPFVMGVMADLSGKPAEPLAPVADRKFLEIDVDNFDARMKAMKPRVAFQVPNTLTGEGNLNVDITFESMDDFSPAAVARKVDALKQAARGAPAAGEPDHLHGRQDAAPRSWSPSCSRTRRCCRRWPRPRQAEPRRQPPATSAADRTPEPRQPTEKPRHGRVTQAAAALQGVTFEGSDFASLLKKEFKPKTDEAQGGRRAGGAHARRSRRSSQTQLIGADVVQSIEAMIAEIDKKLTEQINLILHHEDFQKLEGAWRGLHYLVNNTETDEMLKIRVHEHLARRSSARRSSATRARPGTRARSSRRSTRKSTASSAASPSAAWSATTTSTTAPPDVELLGEMAQDRRGRALRRSSPGASPTVMQMDSWQELANPRDLTKIFTTPEYAAWRSLRESEDARYIGLAMPRFLSRLPYGAKTNPVEEFDFEEDTGAADHSKYTWANAAYAMATNINRSFKLYGWCSRIRGVESRRCGRRACRRTPSRPTTAAWT